MYLHKKLGQKVAYLTEYFFIGRLGVVIFYLAGQTYIAVLCIIGDPMVSFTPLCSLLFCFLLRAYFFLIIVFSYINSFIKGEK